MVRIDQNDLRTNLVEIARRERLDRAAGAYRHERRRVYDTVSRDELATARTAIDVGHPKAEWCSHLSYTTGLSVKRLRVGVVYGGRSSEYEVSVASAAAVIANLAPARYGPVPIHIDKEGRWSIATRTPTTLSAADVIQQARIAAPVSQAPTPETHLVARPTDETLVTIQREVHPTEGPTQPARATITGLALDVVFPIVHGPYGEDGTLQGLLELANVPYVGAGVLSSAIGMDKAVARILFAARGLPTVAYEVVTGYEWAQDPTRVIARLSERLSLPMFVKPANLGSSVGVSKANNHQQLETALTVAREFDAKLIVEAAVPNAREIECAVLGNENPEASVPGEIVPSHEFYDYEAKYVDDGARLIIPAVLTPEQTDAIRAMAVEAFRAIEGAGMARVDFLMARDSERLYLNEVNTIPGFMTISMYAKLWDASGVEYTALLDRLIQLAIARHRQKQELRTSLT